MTDSSGNLIVVSEVQTLTRAAQATGSLVINQDVTNNPVVVSHGEYLTDDGLSSGAPLEIAAGNTATLSFSNDSQFYRFTLDADGNGNIGADETFTLDAVNEDFQAAIERLTLDISTAGGLTSRPSSTVIRSASPIIGPMVSA